MGESGQTPATPDHVELVATWGLTRLVYAAAHACHPWDVDSTDGGYEDVARVLFDEQSDMVGVLAKAAGLPEDADYAHVLEWITDRAGRTVLELPGPMAGATPEQATWQVTVDNNPVAFDVFRHWSDNSPVIERDFAHWGADELRAYCLAGLAAADFADRLASESSGEAGDE